MAKEVKEEKVTKKVAPKKKTVAKKAAVISDAKKTATKKPVTKKASAKKAPVKSRKEVKKNEEKVIEEKIVTKPKSEKASKLKTKEIAKAKDNKKQGNIGKKDVKAKVAKDKKDAKAKAAKDKKDAKAKAAKAKEDLKLKVVKTKEAKKQDLKSIEVNKTDDKPIAKKEKKEDAKVKRVLKRVRKDKVIYKLKSIDKRGEKKISKSQNTSDVNASKKRQELEKEISEKRDKKLLKSLKKISALQARLDEIEHDPIMEIRKRHKREKSLETRIELIKRRNAEKHALKDFDKARRITTKKSMDLFMQKGSNSVVKKKLLGKSEFELKGLVRAHQYDDATERSYKSRDNKIASLALFAFENADKAKESQAKVLENKRKAVNAEKAKDDKRKAKVIKRIAKRKAKVEAKDARDRKSFERQVAIAKKELKRQLELEFAQKTKTDEDWKTKEIEELKLQIAQVNNEGIESVVTEYKSEISDQEDRVSELNDEINNFETNTQEQIKERDALYEELERTKEVVIKLNMEFEKKIANAVSEASISARKEVERIKAELKAKADNDNRLQESIAHHEQTRKEAEIKKAKADEEARIEFEEKKVKRIEQDAIIEEQRLHMLSQEREKNASYEIDRFNKMKDDIKNKRDEINNQFENEKEIALKELEEAKRVADAKHAEALGKIEELADENKDEELDSTKQIDLFKSKINKDW